jgi:hypothetical protein
MQPTAGRSFALHIDVEIACFATTGRIPIVLPVPPLAVAKFKAAVTHTMPARITQLQLQVGATIERSGLIGYTYFDRE